LLLIVTYRKLTVSFIREANTQVQIFKHTSAVGFAIKSSINVLTICLTHYVTYNITFPNVLR